MSQFSFRSELLRTLQERDFIYQVTDGEALDAFCLKGKITGYIGFDATANSLQVGNLSAIMLLRWMQKLGHTPIVLLGGGTSRVGDPSFRQTSRPLASLDQIRENIQGIARIFSCLLNFEKIANRALLLNNEDWLVPLRYVDFLRDYGCHFTVNRMLSFESVKTRLDREEPLSFLEFNYMLMQAYDFYYLHENYACSLQMGGSDQWGNIVNGVELTRKLTRVPVFGLTAPLVTNAAGQKMGKTAEGAVWLNGNMLLPYDYWQFWRNTDDRDVGRYLKKFTDLPLDDIQRLAQLSGNEINEAKKILADEATAMVHGRDVLEGIHAAAGSVFLKEERDDSALPSLALPVARLPMSLADLFVLANLCESKGEFKRLVAGKGASFQNEIIENPKQTIAQKDFSNGYVFLSLGKKRHVKVVLTKS
ncbi:tyrosine--tRNA ligase [Alphaproteobacteria bacterium]|nr:tyrosine--tRNA ligase [Alphaproteobacteria bacterium]GHS95538.1 tyrosine--tRNA ligase [Alphaproteobacteria bacterium]